MEITLVTRQINSFSVKQKYQMPKMDYLFDLVADRLYKPEGEAWFTLVDMQYGYC